jgi:DGQHR domain-containing protein
MDLLDDTRYDVDRWNNTSQRGYQREVNDPHARRIAQYMKGKIEQTNVMPTPIVVNFREDILVVPTSIEGVVRLEIADGIVGYIMDGQHRINGISKVAKDNEATLEGYEFGVTITNLPLEQEMIHFKNLNATANRPAKGLSQVIGYQLYEMTGQAPVTYTDQATNLAVALAIRLATDVASPLYGKVAIGGIRKRNFHTTVQSSLVTGLLPLFTNGRFSDHSMKPEQTYQYVLDFFKAVESVWPEAVANPDASTILRTIGLQPLFKILSKVFNNLNLNPSQADFESILVDIRTNLGVDDDSWATRPQAQLNSLRAGYSLNRGNAVISDYLWSGVETKAHSVAN